MEKMIKSADIALKDQQRYIDMMEQKMIDTLKARRKKESENDADNFLNPKSLSNHHDWILW